MGDVAWVMLQVGGEKAGGLQSSRRTAAASFDVEGDVGDAEMGASAHEPASLVAINQKVDLAGERGC